ncbi:MAG: NAD(P)/FAD-dependent oxidoreductase [Myxococcaceae bacterium]
MKHAIVIGGGFGGLTAARAIANTGGVKVTVIDRQNHHLFQPLLYQVATAGLSPGDIASPIRKVLGDDPNVAVELAEVTGFDLANRKVFIADVNGARQPLGYDYLVVAAGARHSYFGHPQWEATAPGLKSLDDALELRRRVLLAFERAELSTDEAERKALLTFAVVGGGATGVELAGALAELSRFTVAGDFRRIDPRQSKVILIEAGPRMLSAFDERLASSAKGALEDLGVEVLLQTRVTEVSPSGVRIVPQGGKEQFVAARTVMWAAGVEASPLGRALGQTDRSGRVKVKPDLSVEGHPEVFAIGDMAWFETEGGGSLPGLAPVAIQQGKHVARVIQATEEGLPRRPFDYFDKGIMATIGRAAGIAQSGPLRLSGFLGWLAWLFVHLLYIIEFRNRLLVMVQWAWAYVTFQRGARLITGPMPHTDRRMPDDPTEAPLTPLLTGEGREPERAPGRG